MGTTREDILGWLKEGQHQGATHVVVVCDTFDHGDYPVYVMPGEPVRKKADEYNRKEMQRVMEVYALHLDLNAQLSERRSFHYEEPPRAATVLRLVPKLKAPVLGASIVSPAAWTHVGTGSYRRLDGKGIVTQINSHKWSASAQTGPARDTAHVAYGRTAREAMELADVTITREHGGQS